MPTTIKRLPLQVHDTATFRAWISGTMQAIEEIGWVNTNVSGTLNSSSVDWPATTLTNQYVIYRSNDAWQAASPVFLRLRFNRSTTGLNSTILLSAQLGHTINDADSSNLVGGTARNVYNPNIIQSGAMDNLYVAGNASYLTMCFAGGLAPTTSTNRAYYLGVARTNDITGSYTGDGVFLFQGQSGTTVNTWFGAIRYQSPLVPYVIEPSAINNIPIVFADDTISDTVAATWFNRKRPQVGMMYVNVQDLPPSMNWLCIKRRGADATLDVQTLNVFNRNVTYLNIGSQYSLNAVLSAGEGALLLRWE